jgi:hypothetical protein
VDDSLLMSAGLVAVELGLMISLSLCVLQPWGKWASIVVALLSYDWYYDKGKYY